MGQPFCPEPLRPLRRIPAPWRSAVGEQVVLLTELSATGSVMMITLWLSGAILPSFLPSSPHGRRTGA